MVCKKLLILTAFCWFISSSALFAQSPVVVSGVVQDAGGNVATSGYVEFDISPVSSSIHYYVPGVTAISPQSVQCVITSSGTLQGQSGGACQVWGNDVLSPSNSTYTVTFAPSSQVTNTIANECLSGTTYNINSPVFCPVVSIVPQYSSITAPVIQGNLVPSVNNVFTLGNAQAFYANAFINNLTFPSSFSGCLYANGGIVTSAACALGTFLPLSGGTMTGPIVLPSTPPTGYDAVNFNFLQSYVPSTVSGLYLPLVGGTLSGNLNGTNSIFSGFVSANQFEVNGLALAASNLSNGALGTGAVCLFSSTTCYVKGLTFTSSNTNLLAIAGSPVGTGSSTVSFTVNGTGNGTKIVTANAPGTSGTPAQWDVNGNLVSGAYPAVPKTQYMNVSSSNASPCTTGTTSYATCTFTVAWTNSSLFTSSVYAITCTPAVVPSGALTGLFVSNVTATSFQITFQNGTNSGAIATTVSNTYCVGLQ